MPVEHGCRMRIDSTGWQHSGPELDHDGIATLTIHDGSARWIAR